ncbi:MAG: hypothetical protein J2O47_07265, partial [Acidimicrobiaceae bacterium]|nr:hypothetical protein [Acidimicrobiaceae bacterium]
VIRDPDFFFNNPYRPTMPMDELAASYGDAKEVVTSGATRDYGRPSYWTGNFFPDMSAWDNLRDHSGRGAGGSVVNIRFAGHPMGTHMSVFPNGTYKKAHRHGPGRLIVIPGGEGYSLLWEEGQEKIVVPWQQDSVFVPPEHWYHQHFNVGTIPARYLALGPLPQFSGHLPDSALDAARNEIPYVDEDPWVRQYFEEEVAKHGGKSLMPDEAYTDPEFRFSRMR